jgi:hypothetical protein
LVGGEPLFNVFGAQLFNYTDALDALPNVFYVFGVDGVIGSN